MNKRRLNKLVSLVMVMALALTILPVLAAPVSAEDDTANSWINRGPGNASYASHVSIRLPGSFDATVETYLDSVLTGTKSVKFDTELISGTLTYKPDATPTGQQNPIVYGPEVGRGSLKWDVHTEVGNVLEYQYGDDQYRRDVNLPAINGDYGKYFSIDAVVKLVTEDPDAIEFLEKIINESLFEGISKDEDENYLLTIANYAPTYNACFDGAAVKPEGGYQKSGYDFVINIAKEFRENTLRTPYSVVYTYTGEVPEGAPALGDIDAGKTGETAVAADPELAGYTFSGWTVGTALSIYTPYLAEGTVSIDDADSLPGSREPLVTLSGYWTKNDDQQYGSIKLTKNISTNSLANGYDNEDGTEVNYELYKLERQENIWVKVNDGIVISGAEPVLIEGLEPGTYKIVEIDVDRPDQYLDAFGSAYENNNYLGGAELVAEDGNYSFEFYVSADAATDVYLDNNYYSTDTILTIKKAFQGENPYPDQEFYLDVTFGSDNFTARELRLQEVAEGAEDAYTVSGDVTLFEISGDFTLQDLYEENNAEGGSLVFTINDGSPVSFDENGYLILKGGQSLVVTGDANDESELPWFVLENKVKVVEKNIAEDYELVGIDIDSPLSPNDEYPVRFVTVTNQYDAPLTPGELTITKLISGNRANADDEFTFLVEVLADGANGSYSWELATLTLKHGETATIPFNDDINGSIKITEVGYGDYTPYVNGQQTDNYTFSNVDWTRNYSTTFTNNYNRSSNEGGGGGEEGESIIVNNTPAIIEPEVIPLAEAPAEEPVVEVLDEEVPLAANPHTGAGISLGILTLLGGIATKRLTRNK